RAERRQADRARRRLPAHGRRHAAADHLDGLLPLVPSATSRPRAAIVVTGSELVRGERTDLNGPFLAQQLLSLGLEPARISIVGDTPGELAAALGEGLQADLCIVSGGLGPTHADRTVELLAPAAGSPSCCRDRRRSCGSCGHTRSRPSRCRRSSVAVAARPGEFCASTAPASPPSPRRSPPPVATGTAWRRRSAPATSRSTSTS